MKTSRPLIYTAIFGSNITLTDPLYVSDEIDYVCFTDQEDLKSAVYEIRRIESPSGKNQLMDVKMVKLLPHKFWNKIKN